MILIRSPNTDSGAVGNAAMAVRIAFCDFITGATQQPEGQLYPLSNSTGYSTGTWAFQYRQNKAPFLNDVYLSWLGILLIGGGAFP
jgi:hypothetical protein